MSNNNIEKLEPILQAVRPENWQDILEKYRTFSSERRQDLSEEINLEDDQVEAVDLLVADLTEKEMSDEEKGKYVDALEAVLDANLTPNLETPFQQQNEKVPALGFGKGLEHSEEAKGDADIASLIFAALTKEQKVDLLSELEKTGQELPPEKQRRLEQLNIVKLALSAIANNFRHQGRVILTEHEEAVEAMYYQHFINSLAEVEEKIVNTDEPLDKLLDPKLQWELAAHWPEGMFRVLRDKNQQFILDDKGQHQLVFQELPTDQAVVDQYIQLIDFIRDQREYGEAQTLIENVLLKPEFDQAREVYFFNRDEYSDEKLQKYRSIKQKLSKLDGEAADGHYVNQVEYKALLEELREFEDDVKGVDEHGIPGDFRHRGSMKNGLQNALNRYDEKKAAEVSAREKINKLTRTKKVIDSWTKGGLSIEQQEQFRKQLIEEDVNRSLNVLMAKKSGNELFTNLDPQKRAIMDRYKRIMDTGEWYEMSAQTWDMVVDELIVNAPLIVLSGGAAALVRGGLSLGARALIMGGRLGRGFALAETAAGATRVALTAEAGLASRAAYMGGRYILSPLAGGAAFEVANVGLHDPKMVGELVEQLYGATFGTPEEKEYLKTLPQWGKDILWTTATLGAFHVVGEEAKTLSDVLLKGSKIFPDKSVRAVMAKLVITGNLEAATMLSIGALRHGIEKGDFKDWDMAHELIHAYVAVGALRVVGGAIKIGGKLFKPPVKPDGGGKAVEKSESPLEERVQEGGKMEVATREELARVQEVLEKEGYKLEIKEDGEVIASKKGSPDLILLEKGELAKESAEVKTVLTQVADNPSRANIGRAERVLSRLGLSAKMVAAIINLMLIPNIARANWFTDLITSGTEGAADGLGSTAWAIAKGLLASTPVIVAIISLVARSSDRRGRLKDLSPKVQSQLPPLLNNAQLNTKINDAAVRNVTTTLDAELTSLEGKDNSAAVVNAKNNLQGVNTAVTNYNRLIENQSPNPHERPLLTAEQNLQNAHNDLRDAIEKGREQTTIDSLRRDVRDAQHRVDQVTAARDEFNQNRKNTVEAARDAIDTALQNLCTAIASIRFGRLTTAFDPANIAGVARGGGRIARNVYRGAIDSGRWVMDNIPINGDPINGHPKIKKAVGLVVILAALTGAGYGVYKLLDIGENTDAESDKEANKQDVIEGVQPEAGKVERDPKTGKFKLIKPPKQ